MSSHKDVVALVLIYLAGQYLVFAVQLVFSHWQMMKHFRICDNLPLHSKSRVAKWGNTRAPCWDLFTELKPLLSTGQGRAGTTLASHLLDKNDQERLLKESKETTPNSWHSVDPNQERLLKAPDPDHWRLVQNPKNLVTLWYGQKGPCQ